MSLESTVRNFLSKNNIQYVDYSDSGDKPDFLIKLGNVDFYLEVKEKRQHTKMANWPNIGVRESDVFILDELTARRLLLYSPNAGVLVYSHPTKTLTFFDVLTLWLSPKRRVNRVINQYGTMKGKWMMNMQNGQPCGSLTEAIRHIQNYTKHQHCWLDETACIGEYAGEIIPTGGEIRTRQQRAYDYSVTR